MTSRPELPISRLTLRRGDRTFPRCPATRAKRGFRVVRMAQFHHTIPRTAVSRSGSDAVAVLLGTKHEAEPCIGAGVGFALRSGMLGANGRSSRMPPIGNPPLRS